MQEPATTSIPITLSSASVYPLTVHDAFAVAKDVGYDGLEVLITGNQATQSATALLALMDKYQLPIRAIHAPTLLLTQQVWGSAWAKIERSVILAQAVGAEVVVAHPPFRWQGNYALEFAGGVQRLTDSTGMKIAVENMYPWRARGREAKMYLPHWDPVPQSYPHVTWDFSHAAIAEMDSRKAVEQLGERLAHLHLCDGLNNGKDEHLVPGRGTQPVAETLQYLRDTDFGGVIAVEVSTRKAKGTGQKEQWLGETLEYARTHLALPDTADRTK
ncbi:MULTISPECIES: sugar phosphate isomerase/epimerase [Glutamicibacter]|uniref:Sugar phosphate isomerase n=1 Tax=Glutamicibacter creatinolyticus TaxID=162496 RepID=A0A5B7WVK7_9MICC|nr:MULTISPECIES: sugar phosphate isomerase/epimerase [Glutamicibacter]QCY47927.1 Sugar phosphate isomerase [Glutamicibacter creatinolyticus]TLK50923.1 sugar phosphate isomerase/epimerase [Glutamicibacter sp. V16R2B1]